MSVIETHETFSGRAGAREILVWDPLVRLIHWSVAAAVLVNSLNDADGVLHEWIGYAAVTLVGIRVLWGIIGPKPARLPSFPPNPRAAVAHLLGMMRPPRRVHLSHNPAGALMVYNLWATLLALGATGFMMGTDAFFGVGWVEELHEGAWVWLLVSVALHVGGVVVDTLRTGVPLVRAMIDGRKRIPPRLEVE